MGSEGLFRGRYLQLVSIRWMDEASEKLKSAPTCKRRHCPARAFWKERQTASLAFTAYIACRPSALWM